MFLLLLIAQVVLLICWFIVPAFAMLPWFIILIPGIAWCLMVGFALVAMVGGLALAYWASR